MLFNLKFDKRDFGIFYRKGGKSILFGFIDNDYAGDQDDRKSTSWYVFMFGTGAILLALWQVYQIVTSSKVLEKKMKDKKEEEKDAKINKKDEEKFESLTEQASDQRSSVCFFIQAQLLQDNSTSTLQRQPRKLSLHTGRGFAYSLFGCSENNNGKGHSC